MAEAQTQVQGNGQDAAAPEKERQEFCKKSWNKEARQWEWKFANGHLEVLKESELNAETKENLCIHGGLQKGGDSYAGAKGDFTVGITKLQGVLAALRDGSWTVERETGPRLSDLAEAVARLKSKPIDECLENIKSLSEDELLNLRTHPAVKLAMADIKAEKARAAFGAAAAQSPLVIPGIS